VDGEEDILINISVTSSDENSTINFFLVLLPLGSLIFSDLVVLAVSITIVVPTAIIVVIVIIRPFTNVHIIAVTIIDLRHR